MIQFNQNINATASFSTKGTATILATTTIITTLWGC